MPAFPNFFPGAIVIIGRAQRSGTDGKQSSRTAKIRKSVDSKVCKAAAYLVLRRKDIVIVAFTEGGRKFETRLGKLSLVEGGMALLVLAGLEFRFEPVWLVSTELELSVPGELESDELEPESESFAQTFRERRQIKNKPDSPPALR